MLAINVYRNFVTVAVFAGLKWKPLLVSQERNCKKHSFVVVSLPLLSAKEADWLLNPIGCILVIELRG